jgi:hypothetical protein
VAKVSRSTLQKDITLHVNKKWRIEKVADAPEKYRVAHSFAYAPNVHLYVTDDASIVPFRASLIQEISFLVMFLFAGASWMIFTGGMSSILNHSHGFVSELVAPACFATGMAQFVWCGRYVMLYKQNKIYYSWF